MTTTPENCIACAKNHAAHEEEHRLMELPIHSIEDGWSLVHDPKSLYLKVKDTDGVTRGVIIERKK